MSQNVNNGGAAPLKMEGDLKKEQEAKDLKDNLEKIKNKIVVLSGKGGVGKSTVAVNLAVSLAEKGHKVGLMDVDIHGPSIPTLLNLEDEAFMSQGNKLLPIEYSENLKVVSIGFLIKDKDEPVVWKGPLKHGAILQFFRDVAWGELDYLIVDSPPGTGDEPLAVCQLIDEPTGAVVVTTPQDVALIDVRKSVTFCHKLNMPVIGVVENMSGFACPHCGENIDVFKSGGGENMSKDMNVPFLGMIPLHQSITLGGDSGKPVVIEGEDQIKNSFNNIIDNIVKFKKIKMEY